MHFIQWSFPSVFSWYQLAGFYINIVCCPNLFAQTTLSCLHQGKESGVGVVGKVGAGVGGNVVAGVGGNVGAGVGAVAVPKPYNHVCTERLILLTSNHY